MDQDEFKYKLYMCFMVLFNLFSDVEIDYGLNRLANIVKNTIEVDKELRPSLIKRELAVVDSKLKVYSITVLWRLLII